MKHQKHYMGQCVKFILVSKYGFSGHHVVISPIKAYYILSETVTIYIILSFSCNQHATCFKPKILRIYAMALHNQGFLLVIVLHYVQFSLMRSLPVNGITFSEWYSTLLEFKLFPPVFCFHFVDLSGLSINFSSPSSLSGMNPIHLSVFFIQFTFIFLLSQPTCLYIDCLTILDKSNLFPHPFPGHLEPIQLRKPNKSAHPVNFLTSKESIGDMKYTKSKISQKQSIIKKNTFFIRGIFFLIIYWFLIVDFLLVKNKHVLEGVEFWKPVNYIIVDLVIFDTPYSVNHKVVDLYFINPNKKTKLIALELNGIGLARIISIFIISPFFITTIKSKLVQLIIYLIWHTLTPLIIQAENRPPDPWADLQLSGSQEQNTLNSKTLTQPNLTQYFTRLGLDRHIEFWVGPYDPFLLDILIFLLSPLSHHPPKCSKKGTTEPPSLTVVTAATKSNIVELSKDLYPSFQQATTKAPDSTNTTFEMN
ncbi:hypothetical protein VP01_4262g2 [Puccinia sorghi]|uniref:Uncharacterized protein n=1 Tax=Puccinia sorghi TaxID=27349 RepID=A0A0L6UQD2_9BASI|nr:hypothetical protein VP01_4262g2 [Puccinia sorghi]